MPTTGITKCAMARQLTDTPSGMTYENPEIYPNIQELDIKPKINTDKAYAQNQLIDQASMFDSADVSGNFYDCTVAQRAKLLGQNIDGLGGTYAALGDIAPYMAILYKSPLTGGQGNRYGVLYKGQWTVPDDTMKGLEGKPDLGQTPKLAGTWQATDYFLKVADPNSGLMVEKHPWEYHIDTTEDLDNDWFSSVHVPGSDTTPLTATSVPLDNATGVAAGSDVVITFNKALFTSTVNGNNVFLMKQDGTAIATTVSVDTTGKIVTLHPATNLAAGSYIAVVTKNVISLSGNTLTDELAINFTV